MRVSYDPHACFAASTADWLSIESSMQQKTLKFWKSLCAYLNVQLMTGKLVD